MPKTEKKLTAESLARELELLAKRYEDSEDEAVQSAVEILVSIRRPLALSPKMFQLVSKYMEGLDSYVEDCLTKAVS